MNGGEGTATQPTAAVGYDLTSRARELLVYLSNRETCPSYDEMAAALQTGRASVHRLVGQLERRGYISRTPTHARSIRLLERAEPRLVSLPEPPARCSGWPEVVHIPLYGRIE